MRSAIDVLFPLGCAGCDAPGTRWCPACGLAMAPYRVAAIDGVRDCVAVARYDGAAGRALRWAKYGRDRAAMWVLAEEFAEHLAPLGLGHDLVVPVPSPWTRKWWRGF